MGKIILVGCDRVVLASAMQSIQEVYKQQIEVVVMENKKKIEEIRNKAFQPEPLILKNFHEEYFETKINEISKNKFLDKPRNNFKKRCLLKTA